MKRTAWKKAIAAMLSRMLLTVCFQALDGNARESSEAGVAAGLIDVQMDETEEETGTDETSANFQGTLMMLTEDVEAREEPRRSSAIVAELTEGSQLFVTGETGGWYQIFYQGKTAYVPEDAAVASTEVDKQALDDEMKKAEEEGAAFIESLETQRAAARRARIWQAVIIVLIVAIFVSGVISAVKSAKADKKKEAKNDVNGENIK